MSKIWGRTRSTILLPLPYIASLMYLFEKWQVLSETGRSENPRVCGNSCSVCRLSSRPNIGTISTRYMRRENPQENLRCKYGLEYVHHKDAALFDASSRTDRIAHAVQQYLKSPAPYCQRSVGMSPRKFPQSILYTGGSLLAYSTVYI
jgi:hypothetical protein